MKTNISTYDKVQDDVIKKVRSGITTEGFIIVSEYDLNELDSEMEGFYRFVIDCNPRLASELEKKDLAPNLPFLNLTIQGNDESKSKIEIVDLNFTMTEFQLKRFKPIIPLLEEYITRAVDG